MRRKISRIEHWTIIVDPEHGDPCTEKVYAQKVLAFLNEAKVGDSIVFESRPREESEYTFSILGRVFDRIGFNDGANVQTSYVFSMIRIGDDLLGSTRFVVETAYSYYLVHASEEIYANLLKKMNE